MSSIWLLQKNHLMDALDLIKLARHYTFLKEKNLFKFWHR